MGFFILVINYFFFSDCCPNSVEMLTNIISPNFKWKSFSKILKYCFKLYMIYIFKWHTVVDWLFKQKWINFNVHNTKSKMEKWCQNFLHQLNIQKQMKRKGSWKYTILIWLAKVSHFFVNILDVTFASMFATVIKLKIPKPVGHVLDVHALPGQQRKTKYIYTWSVKKTSSSVFIHSIL